MKTKTPQNELLKKLAPVKERESKGAETHIAKRRLAILCGVANGKNMKQLAHDLHISSSALYSDYQQVMSRLGIYTIAGLTKYAIRQGLVNLDDEGGA